MIIYSQNIVLLPSESCSFLVSVLLAQVSFSNENLCTCAPLVLQPPEEACSPFASWGVGTPATCFPRLPVWVAAGRLNRSFFFLVRFVPATCSPRLPVCMAVGRLHLSVFPLVRFVFAACFPRVPVWVAVGRLARQSLLLRLVMHSLHSSRPAFSSPQGCWWLLQTLPRTWLQRSRRLLADRT